MVPRYVFGAPREYEGGEDGEYRCVRLKDADSGLLSSARWEYKSLSSASSEPRLAFDVLVAADGRALGAGLWRRQLLLLLQRRRLTKLLLLLLLLLLPLLLLDCRALQGGEALVRGDEGQHEEADDAPSMVSSPASGREYGLAPCGRRNPLER